jgi:hypothetical protein
MAPDAFLAVSILAVCAMSTGDNAGDAGIDPDDHSS